MVAAAASSLNIESALTRFVEQFDIEKRNTLTFWIHDCVVATEDTDIADVVTHLPVAAAGCKK